MSVELPRAPRSAWRAIPSAAFGDGIAYEVSSEGQIVRVLNGGSIVAFVPELSVNDRTPRLQAYVIPSNAEWDVMVRRRKLDELRGIIVSTQSELESVIALREKYASSFDLGDPYIAGSIKERTGFGSRSDFEAKISVLKQRIAQAQIALKNLEK